MSIYFRGDPLLVIIIVIGLAFTLLIWFLIANKLVAIMPWIMGIAFVFYGVHGVYWDQKFDGIVVRTSGIVDALNQRHGRGGPSYLVNYHYDTKGKTIVVEDSSVPEGKWLQPHLGDTIPIKYPYDTPDKS